MFIGKWMDKHIVVHLYNGILFSNKMGSIIGRSNSMNEFQSN